MATYYKKIKGKSYDKKLVDKANSMVRGKGDGRISLQDAKSLLRLVKDSGTYTDIEKSTMKYIRDHYSFTPESNKWFRSEIAKWAAAKGTGAKKPAILKKTAAAIKKTAAKKPKAPARKAVKPGKKTVPQKTSTARYIEKKFEENEPVYREQTMPARTAPSGKKSLAIRIILFFLILIIIAILIALLSPTCRERIMNKISPTATTTIDTGALPQPEIRPAEEQKAETTPVPVEKKVPEAKPEPKPEPEKGNFYTVQVKDDLVKISEKLLGDYNKWKDVYEANRDIIKYPTMIFPGQKLRIPEVQGAKK